MLLAGNIFRGIVLLSWHCFVLSRVRTVLLIEDLRLCQNNLERICRACLTEKGDMKPLFGACLDEMLHSFANIEVNEDDGFPNLMCVQCVLQCSRAYTFKQLCEKSDNILQQYLSPEFQQQLAQSIANQQQMQAKHELQEQLQFAEEMGNVVIEEDISEFVTYADDVQLDVREKPHSCEACGKKFASSSSLKVHMRSHTGDKPYICKVCNRGFAQSSSLHQHLSTHNQQEKIDISKLETVEVTELITEDNQTIKVQAITGI
ncbi:hypothetical protein JTB14_017803 [Gonioctena quinquepunctata]|nr:hypothetical protein JTB14_017803 [Gonioctena quinquepunctata]